MALESATYISELVITNPSGSADDIAEGDDHIRVTKKAVRNTFPNFVGTTSVPKFVTLTEDQINDAARKSATATITAAWSFSVTPTATLAEGYRIAHDSAFLSFYNTANAARTGYLQMNPSAAAILNVEANQALDVRTNNISRVNVGTSHASSLQATDDAGTLITVGWRDCPIVTQSSSASTAMADRGKCIRYTGGASQTLTIPANGTVAYPIGTVLTFINRGSAAVTIACGDTMTWAQSGGTGSRTLAQAGMATAIKDTSTSWLISGTGLT